jgi:hypothetical protein
MTCAISPGPQYIRLTGAEVNAALKDPNPGNHIAVEVSRLISGYHGKLSRPRCVDALHRVVCDAGNDRAQIGFRIQAVEFAVSMMVYIVTARTARRLHSLGQRSRP